jgi:predicted DNA binding CopG/RHH family protein
MPRVKKYRMLTSHAITDIVTVRLSVDDIKLLKEIATVNGLNLSPLIADIIHEFLHKDEVPGINTQDVAKIIQSRNHTPITIEESFSKESEEAEIAPEEILSNFDEETEPVKFQSAFISTESNSRLETLSQRRDRLNRLGSRE